LYHDVAVYLYANWLSQQNLLQSYFPILLPLLYDEKPLPPLGIYKYFLNTRIIHVPYDLSNILFFYIVQCLLNMFNTCFFIMFHVIYHIAYSIIMKMNIVHFI